MRSFLGPMEVKTEIKKYYKLNNALRVANVRIYVPDFANLL